MARVSLRSRLLARTIWARPVESFNPDEPPPRFRTLFTVVLPVKYGLFIGFGTLGAIGAVPSVADFTQPDADNVWAVIVGTLALLALTGLVWKWTLFEVLVTPLLVVALSLYPISAAWNGFVENDINRWALSVGLWVFVVLPVWRVFDGVSELRKHREVAHRATQLLEGPTT